MIGNFDQIECQRVGPLQLVFAINNIAIGLSKNDVKDFIFFDYMVESIRSHNSAIDMLISP